jgi:hypothetical protein
MLSLNIEPSEAEEVAKRSRGTPRIANRLLRRVRDYAIVKGHDSILLSDAKSALKMLEIDELGLDAIDNKILKAMAEKFCDWDPEHDAMMGYGTVRYPVPGTYTEKHAGVHISIIYGDYFFTEAILKLLGAEFMPW